MRRLRRLSGAVVAAGLVVLGVAVFEAPPAAACSCALGVGDRGAFEQADAVFVGELRGYERTSVDEARWTFTVSEVFKGEVAETQSVGSAYSGSLCGLELPEQGEFLVFADRGAGPGPDRGAGGYRAHLCGGTRSTSAGPLEAGLGSSRPPAVAQVAEPSAVVDESSSSAIDDRWLVVAAVCVAGLGLVVTTFWRRRVRP